MSNNIILKYIADVQNAITPENANNWHVNIKECTIQTTGDISTEPTQITYDADRYAFLLDDKLYTITPTIKIMGLPAFCITDLFEFHDSSMIPYACKQQMLRNLIDYLKTRNIHLLVGDYMTILRYAGLGNFYCTITDQWIKDEKQTVGNWIDPEFGMSILYVEQIEDAIRIAVCSARLTEPVHTAITEIEYRKLIARTYQYVRTYNTWFGLVYKPLEEILPNESPIIFCDSEGNAVTDVNYSESDKDIYTEIWYDKGTSRHPIRHFEQIQPSRDFRWRQIRGLTKCVNAKATIKQYDEEETLKKYGFQSLDFVLFMYKAILSALKLSEITSMVDNIRQNPDDYLRTDLFIIYNELENLSSCLLEFLNLQFTVYGSTKMTAYALLENNHLHEEISEDMWSSIITAYQYTSKWTTFIRPGLYSNNMWYVDLRTTEDRVGFWNETYDALPAGYPLPEANLTTLRNGYADSFEAGIKWIDINYAQIFSENSGDDLRAELDSSFEADYTIGTTDYRSKIIENQLQCPYGVLYQLEPYLGIRVLQPIQNFMSGLGNTNTMKYSVAFLRDDLIRYCSPFNGPDGTNIIGDRFIIQDPTLISIKGINLDNSIDLSLTLDEMYRLYSMYEDASIRTGLNNILQFNVINYKVCLRSRSAYNSKRWVKINSSTYVSRRMETRSELDGSTQGAEIAVKNMDWNIILPSQYRVFTLPGTLTKETYEPFMYRVMQIQFSVLDQIRAIATECTGFLKRFSFRTYGVNTYKLEWYLFEDLYNVWKVGTTFITNENLINNWLLENIDLISSWYPNITTDVFTYGRIVANSIKPVYSSFQTNLNHIIRQNGTSYVIYENKSIDAEESETKMGYWNGLLNACNINSLYQWRRLTDIRDYSAVPSFIYWISKNTTITMSSTEVNTTNTVNYELIQ